MTTTLKALNTTLLANSEVVKATRLNSTSTTKEVIKYLLESINDESVVGDTKKSKIDFVLKMELEGLKSKQFHDNFKLAVKVARLKLIDGLKVRDELLTLGQLKTLVNEFSISTINGLFNDSDVDTYVDIVKSHFNDNKITVNTSKIKGDKVKKSKKA